MNLEDNLFSYGVYIHNEKTDEPLTFPESFGRFHTTISGSESDGYEKQPTKPCSEVFIDLTQELSAN